MLRSAHRRQVLSAANSSIWCRRPATPQPEQRLERRGRSVATIVPKGELIEIDLQLRPIHTMMSAHEPLLEIPDRAVGERHDRRDTLTELLAQWLGPRNVRVAGPRQSSELLEAVCVDRRTPGDVFRD
jgi:hypothetical protein